MTKETVDREQSIIQRTLPNGDIVNVRTDKQKKRVKEELPKLRTEQVAGGNTCPHCHRGFHSPGILQEHIQRDHVLTAGEPDLRVVTLEDGSEVPMEMVQRAVEQMEAQKEEAVVEEAENKREDVASKAKKKAKKGS